MAVGDRSALAELAARRPDLVVGPGDSRWDRSRVAFAATVDQRPAAVGLPRDADDVAALVAAGRDDGLRIAPQRTGHAAEALDLAGALLLRTDRMSELTVDPDRRTMRAGAGVLTGAAVAAAGRHGLAPQVGSSPTVGLVGFHLGGGVSLVSRRHGLAADAVTAVELVVPDGTWIRATAASESELFWALRGGGGGVGVVTAIEVDLVDLGPVQGGNLFFPLSRAREVMHVWREVALDAPDGLTLAGRVLRLPRPLAELPAGQCPTGPDGVALAAAANAGRELTAIVGVQLGDEPEAAELLAPLRALGPVVDTFGPRGPEAMCEVHMDSVEPMPSVDDHLLLADPLPAAAVDMFVDTVGAESGSAIATAELRQTGGAIRRSGHADSAASLPGGHFAFAAGLVGDGPGMADRARVDGDLARFVEALAPWALGAGFMNFSDRPLPAASFLSLEAGERLRRVARGWDPEGTIVACHPAAVR